MNGIIQSLGQAGKMLLGLRLGDIIDIVLVGLLVYLLLTLIRRTRSYTLFRGIIAILGALWLSGEFHLHTFNYILRKAVELGLLALVILFQPELRRFLEKLGTGSLRRLLSPNREIPLESAIAETVRACKDLAASKTGALIVFERNNRLEEQVRSGTVVDAETSAELLKNMFFTNAPLHDGAVIIRDGRIHAAGCVLPLTTNTNLSKDLGMRHRAGLGMSESSDAVVIIVSEETGTISVALDGLLKRYIKPEVLTKLLRNELAKNVEEEAKQSIIDWFRSIGKGNNDDRKQK